MPVSVAGLIGRGERRLAHPEQVADGVVHVEPAGREHDARARDTRFLASGNHDGVRGLLGRHTVPGAERRRVGEIGIARERLVFDAERGEPVAHPRLDGGRRRQSASRPHGRPVESSPSMRITAPTETAPGETRVALVPRSATQLVSTGATVAIQAGAGTAAGITDAAYREVGAEVVAGPGDVAGRRGHRRGRAPPRRGVCRPAQARIDPRRRARAGR